MAAKKPAPKLTTSEEMWFTRGRQLGQDLIQLLSLFAGAKATATGLDEVGYVDDRDEWTKCVAIIEEYSTKLAKTYGPADLTEAYDLIAIADSRYDDVHRRLGAMHERARERRVPREAAH